MTIPEIFTKIKRKIESNAHLNDKSKLVVLHVLRQVFKEIPKEDLIDYIPTAINKDSMPDYFKDIFGGLR